MLENTGILYLSTERKQLEPKSVLSKSDEDISRYTQMKHIPIFRPSLKEMLMQTLQQ